jgi:hypothetical protein
MEQQGLQLVSQDQQDANESSNVPMRYVLLRIDHMRQRQQYTKTIQKWVAELGLTGKLCLGTQGT